MIVIVSEKPALTRAIGPFAAMQWAGHDIYVLHTLYFSMTAFQYPRGRSWKDYPLVDFARYGVRQDAQWSIYRLNADGNATTVFAEDGQQAATGILGKADEIIYAGEPDPQGASAYHSLLCCLIGYEAAVIKRPALFFRDYSAEAVGAAFADLQSTESDTFKRWLDFGETKRYFDYNFNLNSLAIFGKTMREVSGGRATVPLSKYALQTLFHMRRSGPLAEAQLLHAMQGWIGTGRYSNRQCGLGSPASRAQIVADLQDNGFIENGPARVAPTTVNVSALGNRLLDALHPDCEDPDLPFRIDGWCQEGLLKSGSAINRYIRTYFGKQKRFFAS